MAAKVQSLDECYQDRLGRAGVWLVLATLGPGANVRGGDLTGLAGAGECEETRLCRALPGAGQRAARDGGARSYEDIALTLRSAVCVRVNLGFVTSSNLGQQGQHSL